MFRTMTLAAMAAALAATMAQAQVVPGQGTAPPRTAPPRTAAPGSPARAAVNDALFAAAATISGLSEVQISELGLQRATDPELKRFSQQMVDEHNRMNQELATLAAQKGIPLPRVLDPCSEFRAQSLAGLSGEEFDRCYAKAQLVMHMDSVATVEAEAERGMDPNIRAFAAKGLPRIKEHLKMIKPIAMRYEKEQPGNDGAANPRQEK